MAKKAAETPKSPDASRDGTALQVSADPVDRSGIDDRVAGQLLTEPTGEAEAARIASGVTSDDATEATEAETPAENIAHISDATLPSREDAAAAIERATAGLGKSGKR